jgi:rhamnogalacturonyl hydrolase YesR
MQRMTLNAELFGILGSGCRITGMLRERRINKVRQSRDENRGKHEYNARFHQIFSHHIWVGESNIARVLSGVLWSANVRVFRQMNSSEALSVAVRLMSDFARRTGLSPSPPAQRPDRYLWTDAFAVRNFLALFQRTGDQQYRRCATDLIEQVHRVLGRYRRGAQRLDQRLR